MRMLSWGLVLAWTLSSGPVGALEKVGVLWYNDGGLCDGVVTTTVHLNPYGKPLYVESLQSAIGIDNLAIADIYMAISHTNGETIDIVHMDRYAMPAGIGDMGKTRYFRTPWKFEPSEGILVQRFCSTARPEKPQYGAQIVVEGFLD